MPAGLYGSPQLGPYRQAERGQRGARRLLGALTFEPLWRRIVPWRPPRIIAQTLTLSALITTTAVGATVFARSSTPSEIADQARAILEREATPTFTAEQAKFVAAVATQDALKSDVLAQTPPTTNVVAPIALVSASCATDTRSATTKCAGAVRNISGRRYDGLKVGIGWSASQDGEPLSESSATIDYDTLLPDQTSTWTVVSRYNPALRWYHVTVRDAAGAKIRVRDDRPPAP